jgi:alkaline phosphatase D
MKLSRRLFLTSAAGVAAWPWLAPEADAQLSVHPPNDKDLPPVPPDEPVEGPRFLKAGPMIGHVAHDRALVWVKASNAAKATLQVSAHADLREPRVIQGPALTADTAFSGTVEIPDLQPATRYFYAVLLDGEVVTARPARSFSTAPAPASAGTVRVAFASCSGYRGYMAAASWGEMASRANFDVLLQLGDNHYGNTSDLEKQRANYLMHRQAAGFRDLTASIPCLGIWDDHDFGVNDSDETQPGKENSLRAFKEYWANAAFGEEENAGCYHKFSRGDVDIFMLDGRYHRSPDKAAKDEHKTMLGEKQLAWLKRELKASKAKVKFIASGSVFHAEGGLDSWTSYPAEREALFAYLRDEIGDGVIFLTGDQHFTAGFQVEGRFLEVTSGPLGSGNAAGQMTKESWMVCNIGKMWSVFEVDTTGDLPKVTYELWLAGAGLGVRHELTWDEVNGRAKIAPLAALPAGVERSKPKPK